MCIKTADLGQHTAEAIQSHCRAASDKHTPIVGDSLPQGMSSKVGGTQAGERVYPIGNYTWGHKDAITDNVVDVTKKLAKWRQK